MRRRKLSEVLDEIEANHRCDRITTTDTIHFDPTISNATRMKLQATIKLCKQIRADLQTQKIKGV